MVFEPDPDAEAPGYQLHIVMYKVGPHHPDFGQGVRADRSFAVQVLC